jgi:hypothetical protein
LGEPKEAPFTPTVMEGDMRLSSRLIVAAIFCCVTAAPSPSRAQGPSPLVPPSSDTGKRAVASDREAFARTAPVAGSRQSNGGGNRAPIIGALIGAGAALGFTAFAASKYGENEGGEFCARCMVQWSALTVPVGALAGVGIGWGVGRARRTVTAAPIVSKSAKGIVISARF